MKKNIVLFIIAFCTINISAQTFSNSLSISAPNDTTKYTIHVSGRLMKKDVRLNRKAWTLSSIYTNQVRVKISTGEMSTEKVIKLSPDKNDLQEPYRTNYHIIRKEKKIILKLHSRNTNVK